jgi:hypothetical protein
MIIITLESIYYIVFIISILCSAAYKLGYENGKNEKSNRPSLRNLTITFL